ncbi:hypothetical protein KY317_03505, partial [Candidatus Woesearchaeota archaeon]|nr:hypothetical protein [Candidatus Woesearchaeota archaeon]
MAKEAKLIKAEEIFTLEDLEKLRKVQNAVRAAYRFLAELKKEAIPPEKKETFRFGVLKLLRLLKEIRELDQKIFRIRVRILRKIRKEEREQIPERKKAYIIEGIAILKEIKKGLNDTIKDLERCSPERKVTYLMKVFRDAYDNLGKLTTQMNLLL